MLYLVLLCFFLEKDIYAQPASNEISEASDKRARVLYNNGTILYEEGSYKEAVKAFQEAYRLSNRHALLYNIAAAQERMGDISGAINSLQTYRIYAETTEQESLRRRIDNLRERKRKLDNQKPPPKTIENKQAETTTETKEPIKTENKQTPIKKMDSSPLLGIWGGITGCGLIAGSIFSFQAHSARSELEELCQGSLCPGNAKTILDQDKSAAKWADFSWTLAGIGFVGGTITVLQSSQVHISTNQIQWSGKF